MKYVVDAALCSGHGLCYSLEPEVFRSDEDGMNADAGGTVDVPEHMHHLVRRGADSCPESAIVVVHDA